MKHINESGIFFGCTLGKTIDIVKRLDHMYISPNDDMPILDYMAWVNTQIPDALYLYTTYDPVTSSDVRDMWTHLSLISDDDEMTLNEAKFIYNQGIEEYTSFMFWLDLDYQEPRLFSRGYVFTISPTETDPLKKCLETYLYKLDQGTLTHHEQMNLVDFFIHDNEPTITDEYSEQDIQRFTSLGWYITHLTNYSLSDK